MSGFHNIIFNTDLAKPVTSLTNPRPTVIRPFVADTTPEFRVRFVTGLSTQRLTDLSGYQISLFIDSQNPKPQNGSWTLTDGTNTTEPIPAEATSEMVKCLLGKSSVFPPGVIVSGGNGEWVIVVDHVGAFPEISGTFAGTTATSELVVSQLDIGTSTTRATYRVQVIQEPAITISPAGWTFETPEPSSTLTKISESLYILDIDPDVTSGFYTLTVHGVSVRGISYNATAYEIQRALMMRLRHDLQVENHADGGFLISLGDTLISSDPAIELDDSNLSTAPYWSAQGTLKSEGLRELLEGRDCTQAALEIRTLNTITGVESSVIAPITIQNPVARKTPNT